MSYFRIVTQTVDINDEWQCLYALLLVLKRLGIANITWERRSFIGDEWSVSL